MMIRPGTGNCPGVLFMPGGPKEICQQADGCPAQGAGRKSPLLGCTLEKNNPSRNLKKEGSKEHEQYVQRRNIKQGDRK